MTGCTCHGASDSLAKDDGYVCTKSKVTQVGKEHSVLDKNSKGIVTAYRDLGRNSHIARHFSVEARLYKKSSAQCHIDIA